MPACAAPRRSSQTRRTPVPAPAALALTALALTALLLSGGCAERRPAPPPAAPVETGAPQAPPPPPILDMAVLPQDASAFLDPLTEDRPLFPAKTQQAQVREFLKDHFGPWRRAKPAMDKAGAFWGVDYFKSRPLFGENTLARGPEWLQELVRRSRMDEYPTLARPAVATRHTSMRALPTDKPGFFDFRLPGEGYPFDMLQNSAVWAGTPLLVTHLSSDGAFALCEARFAGGWIPVADLGYVDEAFIREFTLLNLAVPLKDGVPIRDAAGNFLAEARIGMLLPLIVQDAGESLVLVPVRDADGKAVLRTGRIPSSACAPFPLPPTPAVLARLANQLMGQPYGWGGLHFDRDCSSTLLDLFAPLGVSLPRNSRDQSRKGKVTALSKLDPAEKRDTILRQATPFLTFLHKPGHILLYLGAFEGKPAALHTIWGVRTKDPSTGREGRRVIGQTVITTLEPGREFPDVEASKQSLLQTLDRMNVPVVE